MTGSYHYQKGEESFGGKSRNKENQEMEQIWDVACSLSVTVTLTCFTAAFLATTPELP